MGVTYSELEPKGVAMLSSTIWRTAFIALGAVMAQGCSSQEASPGGHAATQPVRWAVTTNDNKQFFKDGVLSVVPTPTPDTASVLDISVMPPKLVAQLEVPGSVQGPPLSVAITPDE